MKGEDVDYDVDSAIKDIIGDAALELINKLKGKKDVSEFKLADSMKMSINEVRNIIYKLDSHNLVSSIRKKDKKKGWYIYYWTFNPDKAIELVISVKQRKLNSLKEELKRESTIVYFICPNDDSKMDIETAMEHQYMCQECGQLMQQMDPVKRIKQIKKQIEVLESDLKILREKEKENRAEREKEIIRIEKREEKKKEREKKKAKKKIVIKKVKKIKKVVKRVVKKAKKVKPKKKGGFFKFLKRKKR